MSVADALASTLAAANANDAAETLSIADAVVATISQQIAERITVAETVGVDAPAQLRVSDITLTSALLTWVAPDDGGSAILRYEYRVGAGAWVRTDTLDRSQELTGLNPGTGYSVAVRAVTALGDGPESDAVRFTTVAVALPSPPLFPRVEAGEGATLVMAWEPPMDDGGGAITAYEAMICDEADQNCGWETVWKADD